MIEKIKRFRVIIIIALLFLAWHYDKELYGIFKGLLKDGLSMVRDLKKDLQ